MADWNTFNPSFEREFDSYLVMLLRVSNLILYIFFTSIKLSDRNLSTELTSSIICPFSKENLLIENEIIVKLNFRPI